MPGLRSQKVKISVVICWLRAVGLTVLLRMRVIRSKMVSSAKAIKASNILALLGKWRYNAASDTPTEAASFAVVNRAPGWDSSICARLVKISSRRFGFLGAGAVLTGWTLFWSRHLRWSELPAEPRGQHGRQ